ncbi:MAG: SCP2 sterol-binding domain-containing protein [bacterium]
MNDEAKAQGMPADAGPKWVFEERLPKRFEESMEKYREQLEGIEGVLQFNIEGEGGGQWHIALSEGKATVHPGESEDPSTTFTVDAADWMAIVRRETDPQTVFMQGKLRIAGDMNLAMRLGQLIRTVLQEEGI